MENPTDAHSAGSGGRGSSKGRMTNHEATGTRDISKILGRGRGDRGGAMARSPESNFKTCSDTVLVYRLRPAFISLYSHRVRPTLQSAQEDYL
jgi:hypothetical protein